MWRNRAEFGSTIVFLVVLLVSPLVGAMDIYVTRLDDTNNLCNVDGCSLREAIKQANGNNEHDTIHLPAGRIELTILGTGEDGNNNGDLDIWTDMIIVGEGPGVSIVDANHRDRVFHVFNSDVSVIFKKMTIRGGGHATMGEGGAGVFAHEAAVVFQNCDIFDNHCLNYPERGGGVLVLGGALWLMDSSVRSNTSCNIGGGISVTGIMEIDRSTISDNHAEQTGAAIAFWGTTGGLIQESTISNNRCDNTPPPGGSLFFDGDLTVEFSTFEGNTNPTIRGQGIDSQITLERNIIHGVCQTTGGPAFVTAYGNLESPGDTCQLDEDGDLRSVLNLRLAPLGFYGGPTMTHRPSQYSPAVDHVFPITLPGCPRPDQRGISRPQDGTNGIGTPCDIGAVELIYSELFLDSFECGYTGAWSDTTP